ncbi:MAG: uracil-DNA glycosylase, partial [Kordiimonadaceae bacterium]|nr:uracil-DNA glycosylase [Kordiimonadaceae bacterium]
AVLTNMGEKKSAFKFGHNAHHELGGGLMLVDSYHCSRYNTNTKRLTTEMFEDVFRSIRGYLK